MFAPENSSMKGTSVHINNICRARKLCNCKVWDFAMALRVRKVSETLGFKKYYPDTKRQSLTYFSHLSFPVRHLSTSSHSLPNLQERRFRGAERSKRDTAAGCSAQCKKETKKLLKAVILLYTKGYQKNHKTTITDARWRCDLLERQNGYRAIITSQNPCKHISSSFILVLGGKPSKSEQNKQTNNKQDTVDAR